MANEIKTINGEFIWEILEIPFVVKPIEIVVYGS